MPQSDQQAGAAGAASKRGGSPVLVLVNAKADTHKDDQALLLPVIPVHRLGCSLKEGLLIEKEPVLRVQFV